MAKYAQYLREDQRLVTLRILKEMPGYRSNSSMLYTILSEYGHTPSRDQVKSELVWLEEQGLVELDDVGGVIVVKINQRGCDVAEGRITVPGVKRPGA